MLRPDPSTTSAVGKSRLAECLQVTIDLLMEHPAIENVGTVWGRPMDEEGPAAGPWRGALGNLADTPAVPQLFPDEGEEEEGRSGKRDATCESSIQKWQTKHFPLKLPGGLLELYAAVGNGFCTSVRTSLDAQKSEIGCIAVPPIEALLWGSVEPPLVSAVPSSLCSESRTQVDELALFHLLDDGFGQVVLGYPNVVSTRSNKDKNGAGAANIGCIEVLPQVYGIRLDGTLFHVASSFEDYFRLQCAYCGIKGWYCHLFASPVSSLCTWTQQWIAALTPARLSFSFDDKENRIKTKSEEEEDATEAASNAPDDDAHRFTNGTEGPSRLLLSYARKNDENGKRDVQPQRKELEQQVQRNLEVNANFLQQLVL